jgi:hypothetical protein
MTEIILTSDQSRLFTSATDGVVFCDPAGNVIGRVPPILDAEEAAIVAEAKRRLASNQPTVPLSDIVKRMKEIEVREQR